MSNISTLLSIDGPSLASVATERRHARDLADLQPAAGATTLAVAESALALAVLGAVLIVSNRVGVTQSFDSFLSMRITLRNVVLVGALVASWPLVFWMYRLYTVGVVRAAGVERRRIIMACTTGSLLALALPGLSRGGGLTPRSIAYFWLITMAGTLALRQARRTVMRRHAGRRVVIVGSGVRALALSQRLRSDECVNYEVVGFLDTPDSTPAAEQIARQHLGVLDGLESLLMQHVIDEVHITLPVKSHYREIQEAILVCERVGVRAKYQADLFDSQVAWPRYDEPGSPTVTMHVVPNDHRLVVKRALDLVGATVLLVLVSPILAVAAIAIKLTSRGPIIFSQERYGLNRRRFRMFKFRTMLVEAEHLQAALEARNEADGPVFKIFDDPRITRVGWVLRRTSIDELPQLVNVIRGEMSLVGPRPLPRRDVTRFTCAADMRRFSVRPGLTCLWQISGRSTLSFSDWINLDLKYIDGWSLTLDIMILVRTLPAVLWGIGAR
jgi:exopolysaccharide biosynthesis polyprenyl glycosylphosphotransferase